jgi:hypothetical protein
MSWIGHPITMNQRYHQILITFDRMGTNAFGCSKTEQAGIAFDESSCTCMIPHFTWILCTHYFLSYLLQIWIVGGDSGFYLFPEIAKSLTAREAQTEIAIEVESCCPGSIISGHSSNWAHLL